MIQLITQRLLLFGVSFLLLFSFSALAGWQHLVRILTDTPDASVYVDGKLASRLDNSEFASEEDKWEDKNHKNGGFGGYVDLGDFEPHKVYVGTSPPSTSDSSVNMHAMPDQPTPCRFFPLATTKPTTIAPPDILTPPGKGKDGSKETWFSSQEIWALTGAGGLILILSVAIFLMKRRDDGTEPEVKPVHKPTIIAQGWPYVMFDSFPEINPIQKIGSGGVASIFLVQEKKRGEVAIKILHENQSSDPILRERFLQEAHVLRKLEKTGVVPAPYTISPQSFSRPWFTMDYLGDMYRLRDMIGGKDHKRLTLDWAFPVAAALCESVDAIHRAGVVHRDLSPENVMYGFGSGMMVRLIDFDSAKLYGESLSRKDLADSMEGGAAVGKVKYTAPEQWANFDSAGPESDAYSVGVMIWEMVTGTPPFVGDSIDKIRECHRNAPREAAPLVHAGVPVPVAELIVSLINPVADRRATLKVVHSEMANLVKR